MAELRKHWIWLVGAGLLVWWLMRGGVPVVDLLARLIGRGRKLTSPTLDENGDVVESIEELTAQAAAVLGEQLEQDDVYLGTVAGSEHAEAPDREKAAIVQVAINDANKHGWSIAFTVTSGKGLGQQEGRRYASRRAMYERDLRIAQAVRAGEMADETQGSTHFVHVTGFKTLGAYQALCAKWYAESKIVPVKLSGIPSFRIFLPESEVT